jgi:hypothetical protein
MSAVMEVLGEGQQMLIVKEKEKEKLLDRFGNPFSDSYCTPRWLTAMLPLVDVDPCSNPRSTVRSRRAYSLERKLNGLLLPWRGSAFINWPYSDPEVWVKKLIAEWEANRCTESIVLCKLDSSTVWWNMLVSYGAPELWTFDKRILFDEPQELIAERMRKYAEKGKPGKGEKSSTNFASAIIHHRGKSAPLALEQVATRWARAA